LWDEIVRGAEQHRRLSAQHVNNALLQWSLNELINTSKNGGTSVTGEQWSERPSVSTTEEHTAQVRAMILDSWRMTIEKLAHHVTISLGSAHGIVQGQLGFPKVYARWAQKRLTRKHKRNRL
jgi:hypothetical protein